MKICNKDTQAWGGHNEICNRKRRQVSNSQQINLEADNVYIVGKKNLLQGMWRNERYMFIHKTNWTNKKYKIIK